MTDFGREPDPKWTELDNKAKIERLRDEVFNQHSLLKKMAEYLEKLVDHDHMGGRIVQPIDKPKIDIYSFNNKEFIISELKDNWLY
jgi:hypothetical protein